MKMLRAGWHSRRRKSYFARFIFSLLLLCAGARSGFPQAPRRVSLTLLSTTDLHGHIFPEDDFTGRPANWGLAKVATLIRGIRAEHPNVLLLDCGDTIQGSALAYMSARRLADRPNPMMAAMNELNYTAMSLGNHEFNFGLDVLSKARHEAKFPLLAANLRRTGAGNPPEVEPYVIRTVAGVRVGIVGFVTPGVVHWEMPENYRGFEFEGILHAARRVIPEVRAKSDLVVVIMHSGLRVDPKTGKPLADDRAPGENAVGDLAEKVPGIDLIFYGHTHLELAGQSLNKVLLAQANYWGRSLAEADVLMETSDKGDWRVIEKSSRTIPVTGETPADAKIVAMAQPYEDATQAWLGKVVGKVPVELTAETARIEATPLLSLLHRAQMRKAEADVSLATVFSTAVRFPAGNVTVRQIFSLYPYDNTLFTVEMTGAQLKEALEHSASFYPAWPQKEGEPIRLPGYEADSAEGVDYVMDLAQPAGQRIRDIVFHGSPLLPEQKIKVAINHYRYYGGGGFSVYRGLPIVRQSTVGIRELLADFVEKEAPEISTESRANWRIEPREAFEALRAEAMRPRRAAERHDPPLPQENVFAAGASSRHAARNF
jgi:2',3'-cyclic-nucleotide 2'-phosphodiesterase / 3'-nucleotidase